MREEGRKAPEKAKTDAESAKHARLSLTLAAFALGMATLGGAGMYADGSYWLVVNLESQQVQAFGGRFSNLLFQWPIVIASRVTDNPFVLQTVFGAAYAAIPVIALGASWWVVRKKAPHLFVWPALGIGLATLPGQFCLVCEGQIVVQLFWPVLLALLVGVTTGRAVLMALFVLLMLFFHPLAALLFGIGAGAAFLIAVFWKERHGVMFAWAGAFLALAALAVLRTVLVGALHDTSSLSIQVWRGEFEEGVAGLPLAAVMVTWLAGLLLLLCRMSRFRWIRTQLEVASALSVLCVGVLLAIWALDPALWQRVVSFRNFAILAAAPLMLFALVDALGNRSTAASIVRRRYQRMGALIALIVFLSVLSIQSLEFHNMSQTALAELRASPEPCVDRSAIAAIRNTPLDGWTFNTQALLLQGRTPQTLVLDSPWCNEAAGDGQIKVVPWEYYQDSGWFNLAPARSRI